MEFRIGLNVGEVIQQGQQIFGDGVNIAARLEAIAEPGGICISGEAYDQLKRKLELEFQFLGEKSVKNISEPVRAYRVVVDGQPKTVTQKKTRPHGFKSTNYF
jgi:adenylate cyclase